MDILNEIKNRRSIRKFKPEMIDDESLNKILEAGKAAPTGMNKQSPVIICITNKEIRKKLVEENARIGGWKEGFDPFYGAPIILLVVCKNMPTALYDGSCVIENMMLEASSLNICSCWIHRAKEEMETEFGKELLKSLGLDDDYIGIGHVCLGYIDGEIPPAKPKKDNWVYFIK